jgi:antitoxin (DNA-binding transcriptional repressor) of toxin-antitoxin stability system
MTVTIEEAQATLPKLIEALNAGEAVVITRNDRPVAKLVAERPTNGTAKPIWQEFQEAFANIAAEELGKLPSDGAAEHDHYIYGTPKRRSCARCSRTRSLDPWPIRATNGIGRQSRRS